MNSINSFIEEHIKSKPMLYIGLKFCIWFAIINVLSKELLLRFPEIMQNYLWVISKISILTMNNGFGLPYEMYELLSGIGIWSGDYLTIVVNETCGGVPIYILYTTLILSFIDTWFRKFWTIILGLITLLIVNNIRIIGITLVKEMAPKYFNFAHEILFVYLMYGIALLLWYRFYRGNK